MQPEPNWLGDDKNEESRKWKKVIGKWKGLIGKWEKLIGKRIGIYGYRKTFEE